MCFTLVPPTFNPRSPHPVAMGPACLRVDVRTPANLLPAVGRRWLPVSCQSPKWRRALVKKCRLPDNNGIFCF